MMRRHSRIFFLLASLLVLFTANAYAAAGPEKLSCPKNDKISAVVRQSWHEEGYESSFALFRSDPATAACYLIDELQVLPETWIRGGYQKNHPKTMHVVWSLWALRHITGGLSFKGKTKHRFNDSNEIEANRRQFLRPENNEVPFFAVWMSRDSLAIAPLDAQNDIIVKWTKWYRETGARYSYVPSEDVDDWYF